MEKKYSYAAYVIMAVLAFVTIVSFIYAFINMKDVGETLSSKDDNILALVEKSIDVCQTAYEIVGATPDEKIALEEYIQNINEYDNVRTKGDIALAMITNTGDFVTSKDVATGMTDDKYTQIQRDMAPVKLDLENALSLD